MRINHNISAQTTQGSLYKVNRDMSKSLQRLSTGLRINTAADDAAGLGVSENLRTQVRGMDQAIKNTQDAMSLLNIADGALNEQSEILQRMRELVIQAKNDTYTQTERNYMGDEFKQLYKEIDRIAKTTNYNGMKMFDSGAIGNNATSTPHKTEDSEDVFDTPEEGVFGAGDNGGSYHFNMMIGANYSTADVAAFNTGAGRTNSYDKSAANMVTIQFGQMDGSALFSTDVNGLSGEELLFGDFLDLNPFSYDVGVNPFDMQFNSLGEKLEGILSMIDGDVYTPEGPFGDLGYFSGSNPTGLERINTMRSYIGATVNRLEHNLNNLQTGMANQQASESLIRDADFAQESSKFTKNQILTQSATSMLAQANMVPQGVLSLLG